MTRTQKKRVLGRIVVTLVLLEVGYLALVNLALNLPLTQTLLNQFRPDRYEVGWERAWSWYPLRVHARGIAANGQTATQQWQANAPAASATVSVLPLLWRTVRLDDLAVRDLDLRVRPRPRADRDDSATRPFFPPIRGRDPQAAAVPPPERGPRGGWKIAIHGAQVEGRHDLWIRHVRGTLKGEASGDLHYETRRGPVSVVDGTADVVLHAVTIGGDESVTRDGTIEGRFALAPFVPSRHRGWRSLAFLTADATVDVSLASLAFLDPYLRRFGGMQVDGAGRMSGRVDYDRGDLVSGTLLRVLAETLSVRVDGHETVGAGDIAIAVDPASPDPLGVDIRFDRLEGRRDETVPLFTGTGLVVSAAGPGRILPDDRPAATRLSVTVPEVEVPDLRVYQHYLPRRWGLSLDGGTGRLKGRLSYSPTALEGTLALRSEDIETGIRDYRFASNLELDLRLAGEASERTGLDLSGSSLRLYDARLLGAEAGTAVPWTLSLTVDRGRLGAPADGDPWAPQSVHSLARELREAGLADWLSSADAELDAVLDLSDLRWLGALFRNPFGLTINGAGEAILDLQLAAGDISAGSRLQVVPRELTVGVLDYVAGGDGEVLVTVEQGGAEPGLYLDARLDNAGLRRRSEDTPMIDRVSLSLTARATGLGLRGEREVGEVRLRIPSARVADMRVYNAYLPAGAPLSLEGGQADLIADIRLEPGSASGFVTLESEGLRARLDEQEVAGRIRLDVRIRDGQPEDMTFDIAGSQLLLDRFRVSGEQGNFDQADWGAGIRLDSAEVQWRRPIRLDMEAGIEMTDSRPIVAMFANQRGEHPFLQKIVTVEDVRGEALLRVVDNEVRLPYALAGSDKITVGAKGLIRGDDREGVFLARYRRLQGILKLRDGERDFDLIRARKTFDAYVPGETPLEMGRRGVSGAREDGTGRTRDDAAAEAANAGR